MSDEHAYDGIQREQALRSALEELRATLSDFRSDVANINDVALRDTVVLLLDTFDPVVDAHRAQPQPSVADDISSLMSGVMSLRLPLDSELGATPSRSIARKNVGLLVFNLRDVMVAAEDLGIRPISPSIDAGSAVLASKLQFGGKLDALKERLTGVENVLSEMEHAGRSPTSFRQQSDLLRFYIGSMRVELSLTKFQLSISSLTVDLGSLTRIIEVMAELTQDFVATVRSWTANLASEVTSLVDRLIFRFRRFTRGASTLVDISRTRPLDKPTAVVESKPAVSNTEGQNAAEGPTDSIRINALVENVQLLRRYARAFTGNQVNADAIVLQTLESLVAKARPAGGYVTRAHLYAEFSARIRMRIVAGHVNTYAGGTLPSERRLGSMSVLERQVFLLGAMEGFSDEDIGLILQMVPAEVEAAKMSAGYQLADILKTRVLIIEDEEFIAKDLAGLFSSLGHEIVGIARTAKEAIDLNNKHSPGLISADIQLQDGSSGLDAVNVILRERSIPVVFITAYPERFLTGARPEPAFLISKPFQPSMVAAVTSQALFFSRNSRLRGR